MATKVRVRPDCVAALEYLASGMSATTCHGFNEIRKIAMCDAWQTYDRNPAGTFGDHIHAAWRRVDQACAAHGGTTPEYGELRDVENKYGASAIERIAGEPIPTPAQQKAEVLASVEHRNTALRNSEDCQLCDQVLNTHCKLHGEQDPRFCQLREEYWTTPSMDSDDVLYKLSAISTPKQVDQVRRHLSRSDG